jgi:CheY-like chemotaxis protein
VTELRVLISDDDVMIRDVLKEVLESEADIAVVAVAGDADEAIRLAERHRPAVAVLDVRMPGGGGARAAREIARRSPDTAILAFSAYADRASIAGLAAAGVTEYLVKGAPNTAIVEAVRGWAVRRPGERSGDRPDVRDAVEVGRQQREQPPHRAGPPGGHGEVGPGRVGEQLGAQQRVQPGDGEERDTGEVDDEFADLPVDAVLQDFVEVAGGAQVDLAGHLDEQRAGAGGEHAQRHVAAGVQPVGGGELVVGRAWFRNHHGTLSSGSGGGPDVRNGGCRSGAACRSGRGTSGSG